MHTMIALFYSDDVSVKFHLKAYNKKLDVMEAIDDIQYVYGFTNRADALRIMRTDMFSPENGDRPDVQVKNLKFDFNYFVIYCETKPCLISVHTIEVDNYF